MSTQSHAFGHHHAERCIVVKMGLVQSIRQMTWAD